MNSEPMARLFLLRHFDLQHSNEQRTNGPSFPPKTFRSTAGLSVPWFDHRLTMPTAILYSVVLRCPQIYCTPSFSAIHISISPYAAPL